MDYAKLNHKKIGLYRANIKDIVIFFQSIASHAHSSFCKSPYIYRYGRFVRYKYKFVYKLEFPEAL